MEYKVALGFQQSIIAKGEASFSKNNHTMKRGKTILLILIILNCLVLLGQIYPEGAPPFAKIINILFLVLSLFYFISLSMRKK